MNRVVAACWLALFCVASIPVGAQLGGVAVVAIATQAPAEPTPTNQAADTPGITNHGEGVFESVEVWIDPEGRDLSGYQVIVRCRSIAQVIGIEGGEGAFERPPSYDPILNSKTLEQYEGVQLLSYQLEGKLPRERVRVCTVHFYRERSAPGEGRDQNLEYEVESVAALDVNGNPIPVKVEWISR